MSQPANQSGLVADCRSSSTRDGFTLIELLVVIAIIGVMISILVPGLSRAREMGRIAKCLSNQRTLAQAVQAFAVDHLGYGQLTPASSGGPGPDEPAEVGDGGRKRYAYEPYWGSHDRLVLSPWPIAYAPYLGGSRLRALDLLTPNAGGADHEPLADIRSRLAGKARMPVLRCPSAPDVVGYPVSSGLLGYIGYASNSNLFGTGGWRPGGPGPAINGQLDRVFRPTDVLMFVDGGGGSSPSSHYGRSPLFVLSGTREVGWPGPWLGDFQRMLGSLPGDRHSRDGALCANFVDGHASYLRPTQRAYAQAPRGSRFWEGTVVTRWSPNPRVSPFNPDGPGPRVTRR